MGSRGSLQLGAAIHDLLRRLVRERLARKPGGHLVEARLDEIDLRLPLSLRGTETAPERFAALLLDHIDRRLDDAVARAAAFRPGHAYCHRCESVGCEHSTPPSCRHVFAGFSPTGTPRWEDFAQRCLGLKHPLVDRLYGFPPALIALVDNRHALHAELLAPFRNPSYELLGQVVAGFFAIRGRAEEGRGVFAITVQVAAWHSAGGTPQVGLNLLGRAPGGEALEALWDRLGEPPWRRAVRWAQSALQSARASGGDGREALERRAEGVLNGLARRLQREQRARSRRTRHAQERHASGERPTRKALEEARAADADSLLVDRRSGALVVLGGRGRTHFFTADGQLVSSARYSREAISRKVKAELWSRAPDDVRQAFRDKLD